MAISIRIASPDDAAAIAAIYRPYVEATRISFEQEPPTAAEMASRITANPIHPWLVLEEDSRVIGYTSTSPMRARRAYRWAVETGIYLHPAAHGRGLGRQLYGAHLDLMTRQGFVTAIVGIALPNDASVALHEKLGFALSGVERGVGFKLGQWVDVGRWQKDLAPRSGAPEEPQPYRNV
jgi:phosphinothricin acetyltransferase